ncbi:glycosylase [Niabella beijingensis]|uniref:glycosylase n=1 Tax=Niabella beijingensis TaxID=2872700 RepID=UPI001CBAD56A|nr:glycosylase [Niabella beijingensis]
MMIRIFLVIGWVLMGITAGAQKKEVPQALMQKIYGEVKTPHKYGLVLAPGSPEKKLDCPTVFRNNGKWYMSYIEFDGDGYETWLAQSTDLLHWKSLGKMLSRTNDSLKWDGYQKAGYVSLIDPTWGGTYSVEKYSGNYWMSYIGGRTPGYEAGLLSIGMAYTPDDVARPHEWRTLEQPVLKATDPDVRWWENKKLYKSSVIWDKKKTLGYPFVMYYNANGDTSHNTPKWRWFERIGMAVSNDMVHWKRYRTDPIVHHRIGITGDGVLQKMGDLWVMFYFGAFWENRKNETFNRFACSYDLVHWTDWKGADLIRSSEPYDRKYAHKPCVVKYKGVVYHFYCAVNDNDQRGIAVATSVDKGKSMVRFANR